MKTLKVIFLFIYFSSSIQNFAIADEVDCSELYRQWDEYTDNSKSDSLWKEFKDLVYLDVLQNGIYSDTCKLKFSLALANYSRFMEKNTFVIHFIDSLINTSLVKGYVGFEVHFLIEKNFSYFDLGKMDSCYATLDKASTLITTHQNNIFWDLDYMGIMVSAFSDLDYYKEANFIFEKMVELTNPKDSSQLFTNHYHFGINNFNREDYESAVASLKEAEKYINAKSQYQQAEFYCLYGYSLIENDSIEQGKRILNKSLTLQDNSPFLEAYCYIALVTGCQKQKNYKPCLENIQTLISLIQTNEFPPNVKREAYKVFMDYYFETLNANSFDKWYFPFVSLVDTIEPYQHYHLLRNNLKKAAFDKFNSQELLNLKHFFSQEYQMYDIKRNKLSKELEAKYQKLEAEKKIVEQDLEIERQNGLIQKRNYVILSFSLLALLLGVLGYSYYRRNQRNLKHNEELNNKNNEINTLYSEFKHRVKDGLQLIASGTSTKFVVPL